MGLGIYGLKQTHCIVLMQNTPEGLYTVTLTQQKPETIADYYDPVF